MGSLSAESTCLACATTSILGEHNTHMSEMYKKKENVKETVEH